MQIDRVNASLTAELQRRGFQVVQNKADADMLLAWHLVTQERTDVRTFNSNTRYNCWNCRRMGMGSGSNVTVRQYTQGTFIVDMIDPDSLQAVWRSVFESRMRDHSDAARATEARDTAIAARQRAFKQTRQRIFKVAHPIKISRCQPRYHCAGVSLGEHNRETLDEFKISSEPKEAVVSSQAMIRRI